MLVKLTRRAIDQIEPPQNGYLMARDTELTGFGLRITAAGARSYTMQGRINGRERRITIGQDGVLTPEQARKEAKKLLGQIATGIDPIEQRAKKRIATVTVSQAFEAYKEARHNLKPRTVDDMDRALAKLGWDKKPIATITPDMVERKHAELGDASKARANLTMRYLRAVLNFAAEKYTDSAGASILTSNPVQRLSKVKAWYRVDRRRTVLKEHELKPWMQAVHQLANEDARDYFLLVLLTGLRRGEASNLRWADVDLKSGTLTIPDTKNRQTHTLPMSDFLRAMLTARKANADRKRAPKVMREYVFASERGRLQNLRYAMAEVQGASNVTFCVHDLRRTFATVADRLDIPGYALKALLNHSNMADVTAGYIVHDVERLRQPMQKITDYLLKAGGIRNQQKVVHLSRNANKAG